MKIMKTLKVTLIAVMSIISFNGFAQLKESKESATRSITTTPATKTPSTPVAWKETTHDFGDIKKGTPVSHDFTFENTTKQTVLITNVKAACGCTATDYTKTPIKPGETAYIKATYNAATSGAFSKTISVTLNESQTPKVLTIKGKVVETQS
jgi:hypothetical protein